MDEIVVVPIKMSLFSLILRCIKRGNLGKAIFSKTTALNLPLPFEQKAVFIVLHIIWNPGGGPR